MLYNTVITVMLVNVYGCWILCKCWWVIAWRELPARRTTADRNGGRVRAPPALGLVWVIAGAEGGRIDGENVVGVNEKMSSHKISVEFRHNIKSF